MFQIKSFLWMWMKSATPSSIQSSAHHEDNAPPWLYLLAESKVYLSRMQNWKHCTHKENPVYQIEQEVLQGPVFQIKEGSQVKNLIQLASEPNKINGKLEKMWGDPHLLTTQNSMLKPFLSKLSGTLRDLWLKISRLLGVSVDQAKRLIQSRSDFTKLVHQWLSSSPWQHHSSSGGI